jgi:N6-L-threonylcarbamoyladenine synthase
MAHENGTVSPNVGAGYPVDEGTVILGIETSCDETAAAVVVGGTEVRSNVVSSQVDLHARFGGVVPEIAGRAHEQVITSIVAEAMVEAGTKPGEIEVVAATVGPGLVGSLLVGVSAAKALALVWDVPFVGVNHLEAHLYAGLIDEPELELPIVTLLVSGGHTMLVAFEDHGRYRVLGSTLDDAAGEAFDKVARFLGLGYPGGPAIDAAAMAGNPEALHLTRPMIDDGYDFSFSGIKTGVIQAVRAHPDVSTPDVAASFQAAVTDTLVAKARRAARELGASAICLGGGVAANSELREKLCDAATEDGVQAVLPSREMCTDNAAMVAVTAWWRLGADGPTGLDAGVDPALSLVSTG